MARLRNVLVVASLYHAFPRIFEVAKHLHRFGWNPIVLTPYLGCESNHFWDPTEVRRNMLIIENTVDEPKLARPKLNRKNGVFAVLGRLYGELAYYPDREKRWRKSALSVWILGSRVAEIDRYDAILSSSSPVTAHLIAQKLSLNWHVPWVADFRDLWSQNHNYPYSVVRRFFDRRLEKKVLKSASALVTISKPLATLLSILHRKDVVVITNGYRSEGSEETPLTRNFSVTYTGQIYEKQHPEKLLVALQNLVNKGIVDPSRVEVRLFGKESEAVAAGPFIRQYGLVSHGAALERQRESQVLWQINWEDPDQNGLYSGKIFEYLGSKRPILATGINDSVKELLKQTNAGNYSPTVADIEKTLTAMYQEYERNGFVSYHGYAEEIQKYSYLEIAKQFAEVLNHVCG